MSQLATFAVPSIQDDWQSTLGLAAQYATSPLPILLIGRYRDQAEHLATRIHALSPQANGPFIKSRCGLFPAAQLEQRFFGRDMAHARAKFRRAAPEPGHLRQAHKGTLFVEQLQAATPKMQDALLRHLTDRPIFDNNNQPITTNFRLIVSINTDLETLIAKGKILRDLAHHLQTITLEIPTPKIHWAAA